jgi:hypothetical protein
VASWFDTKAVKSEISSGCSVLSLEIIIVFLSLAENISDFIRTIEGTFSITSVLDTQCITVLSQSNVLLKGILERNGHLSFLTQRSQV